MKKVIGFLRLLRIPQWYKNLVIFLALFFSANLLSLNKLILTVYGLIILCFASSGNYIINDIIDIKKDKEHPEKRNRPIASGKIKTISALIFAVILFTISFYFAFRLSLTFFYSILGLVSLTFLYSIFLKKEIFVDVLVISINFVIRAVSGAFLINVEISPWLILCPFFLALFLALGKRYSELSFKKAAEFRVVLKKYTPDLTMSLMNISTALLIVCYSFYSFLSNYNLLITLPVALYVTFRFYYLVKISSDIARNPEKIIKDYRMIVGILLWISLVFWAIYF
jgi:4-hydroxybenzoate polyprenyltransferase